MMFVLIPTLFNMLNQAPDVVEATTVSLKAQRKVNRHHERYIIEVTTEVCHIIWQNYGSLLIVKRQTGYDILRIAESRLVCWSPQL